MRFKQTVAMIPCTSYMFVVFHGLGSALKRNQSLFKVQRTKYYSQSFKGLVIKQNGILVLASQKS